MPHQTRDHISCNSRLERTRFELISGTFSGATVAMAVGRRIIEKLSTEGYFGLERRELELERLTREHLERLAHKHPRAFSQIDGVGALVRRWRSAWAMGCSITRGHSSGAASIKGSRFITEVIKQRCVRLFLPAGCL